MGSGQLGKSMGRAHQVMALRKTCDSEACRYDDSAGTDMMSGPSDSLWQNIGFQEKTAVNMMQASQRACFTVS